MVSVIIPVYNGQRTIRRCLASVLHQTYKDIEIVVINDGSTDKTKEIVGSYLSDFIKKTIVNKDKNEGPEKARLTGIISSHGDMVTFVDADDYIEHDYIEKMVKAKKSSQADLVKCGMDRFFSIGQHLRICPMRSAEKGGIRQINNANDLSNLYLSFFGCGNFSSSACAKLYMRSFLEGLKPGGLFFGEDLYFNMQIFPKLKTICIIPDVLYHYELQGTTSRFMPRFMDEVKKLYHLKVVKAKEIDSNAANLYSTIELRNCFKSHVESMILHKVDSSDGIKQWIKKELQDNTYNVFDWLGKQTGYNKSPIAKAIVNKDVEAIYELCRKSVYEWKWKKVIRRLLIKVHG